MEKWIPFQKPMSGLISDTFGVFIDKLAKFRDELDCPDDFICDSLDVVKNRCSLDSCHSKARQHKRDNPSSY